MPDRLTPPCLFLNFSPLCNAFQLPSSLTALLFFQDSDQQSPPLVRFSLAYNPVSIQSPFFHPHSLVLNLESIDPQGSVNKNHML